MRFRVLLPVLCALAAGAILRLFFLHGVTHIDGDPLLYGDIAKNWLTHGVYGRSFSTASGMRFIAPTLIRLPGYPAFLALCFALFGLEHYRAVCFAQVAVDLAGCLLIASAVRRAISSRAGRIALWLAVLCPFTANYVDIPLAETLSIFCVSLACYALVSILEHPRWPAVVTLAFAWSYAAMLRPDGALLAVAVASALLVYGRRTLGLGRAVRLVSAAALLALVPFAVWTIRNWRTFHVFQPLAPLYANDPGEATSPGVERWTKTWLADFTSTYEFYWNVPGDDIEIQSLPSRAFDSAAEYEETRRLFAAYNLQDSVTPKIDAGFGRLAADRIRAHPLRDRVTLPLLRLADMWLRPRVEMFNIELRWWQYSKHRAETRFAVGYGALNLAYLLAGLAGVFCWPGLATGLAPGVVAGLAREGLHRAVAAPARAVLTGALGAAMLIYMILRSLLLLTLAAPEPRYTLECFPLVIAFAAAAIDRLWNSTPAARV
jgi:hypothetical protein